MDFNLTRLRLLVIGVLAVALVGVSPSTASAYTGSLAAPVAVNDTFTIIAGTWDDGVTRNVLSNDTAPSGVQLLVHDVPHNDINTRGMGEDGLWLTLDYDGTLTTGSTSNTQVRSLSFQYRAWNQDTDQVSPPATITIVVQPPPPPPGPPKVVNDVFGPVYANATGFDVLRNDSSPASDGPLRIVGFTQPTKTSWRYKPQVSLVDGKFHIANVPVAQGGSLSFQYTVANSVGQSVATATINYRRLNAPKWKVLKHFKKAVKHRRKARSGTVRFVNTNSSSIKLKVWNDTGSKPRSVITRVIRPSGTLVVKRKWIYLGYQATMLTPDGPLEYTKYTIKLTRL